MCKKNLEEEINKNIPEKENKQKPSTGYLQVNTSNNPPSSD